MCIDLQYDLIIPSRTINNYWMRLSMISRIIQTEVKCRRKKMKKKSRSPRLRWMTLTSVWIILDIMHKLNSIIVLLYVQNSDRCKKIFAVETRAINFPNCCRLFLLFCSFHGLEVVTLSESSNFFF